MTADRLRVELVPRLGPATADYPAGSTFGPRDAQHFQFIWLLRGRAFWSAGDTTVELTHRQLLLVRPGMRDFIRWDERGRTRHAYVHFTVSGHEHLPPPDMWPLTRRLDGRHDPLAALCRYLLWLADVRPRQWRGRARAVLELLVSTFVAGPLPDSADPALPAPIEAMAAHVAQRWSDGVACPLPLRELAAAAGLSVSTLCRLFRQQFAVGPVTALELIRLARAEPLLWMSNLTMAAIAHQCGFADAYHFSRRFRAVYGVPPSIIRTQGPPAAPPAAGLRQLERRLRV